MIKITTGGIINKGFGVSGLSALKPFATNSLDGLVSVSSFVNSIVDSILF